MLRLPATGRRPSTLRTAATGTIAAVTDDPGLAPAQDPDLEDDVHDAADPDEPARELTNGDLARVFHDIGDMLEVKGELVFKTVA
jgi:hypothetical protein